MLHAGCLGVALIAVGGRRQSCLERPQGSTPIVGLGRFGKESPLSEKGVCMQLFSWKRFSMALIVLYLLTLFVLLWDDGREASAFTTPEFIYPNAVVLKEENTPSNHFYFEMETEDKPEEIINFYLQNLQTDGWEVRRWNSDGLDFTYSTRVCGPDLHNNNNYSCRTGLRHALSIWLKQNEGQKTIIHLEYEDINYSV